MDKVENPILKPNKVAALIIYFFMTFIGSGLIIILIALCYANGAENVQYADIIKALATNDLTGASDELIKAYGVVNALGNMVGYLIMLLCIGFYMRNYIIEDTLAWKKRYRFLLWFIPLSAVLFYFISFGIELLISPHVGSSTNQNSIVMMIQEGGSFYMFVAVVICAPIVEELIYRKAIFSLLEKKHIAFSYVLSIVLFALPHMISTTNVSIGDWLLISIPYVTSAIMLAVIYHFSGKNIYATWFVHMVNNLISFIIIVTSI